MPDKNQPKEPKPIMCIGPKVCQICFYCPKTLFWFFLTAAIVLFVILIFLSEVGISIHLGGEQHTH